MARSQKNNDLTSQEVTLVLLKKLSEELFDDIDLEQVCECSDDLHKMAEAFVYRIHFSKQKVVWLEGIPIRLLAGYSRQAYVKRAKRATEKLVHLSTDFGTPVKQEFGRAILDMPK